MPKIKELQLNHDEVDTLMRCATAFREMIVQSSCGREDCEHCGQHTEIIEQVTDVMDKITAATGIEIAVVKMSDILQMSSATQH